MFPLRFATPWCVVFLFGFTVAQHCEEQIQGPTSLTIEEAAFVSDQDAGPIALALQPSASVQEPVVEPVENGIDLSGLLDLAVAQSPRLSVHRARVGQAQMNALATGLLPNPVVQGGGKDVSGGDSGLVIGVEQELPINGSRRLDRQAATLRYSAERAALEREIQVALSEVEDSYVDVLASQELVAVDRHGLEVADDSLRLVSDNYNAGLASLLPLSLATSEQANAKKTLRLSEKQSQVARTRLAGLLGMDEGSLLRVVGDLRQTLLPPGLESSPHSPDRPDLRAANLRVQAAQSFTQSARRKRIPNPTLGYQREEAEDTENFFTIGMEIPLFDSGRPRVQERLAAQQVASREKSALSKTIQTEMEVVVTRLNSAREAVSIYESEIRPSNQKSLEAARGAFQSGTTDLSLLLQTQSSLIEHEREYIRALQELRAAEVGYKLSLGFRKERVQ